MNPRTMVFIRNSAINMVVIQMSMVCKTYVIYPSGSFKGLSIARVTFEIMMTMRINGSKYEWHTSYANFCLKMLSFAKMHSEVPLKTTFLLTTLSPKSVFCIRSFCCEPFIFFIVLEFSFPSDT
jgi:hypothetical protein